MRYELRVRDNEVLMKRYRVRDLWVKRVVIDEEANEWEITVITGSDFDEQVLGAMVEDVANRYGAKVKIKREVLVERVKAAATSSVKKIGKETAGERVTVEGRIIDAGKYGVILREYKTGTKLVMFWIFDEASGIMCKKFFKGEAASEAEGYAKGLKVGKVYKVTGEIRWDEYIKERVLMVAGMEEVGLEREDSAAEKRVELHVHTQMSAMDGLIPVERLIKRAADWGWKAVAITDHGVIQGFPQAALAAEEVAKAGKGIKVIYGMEGYLVGEDYKQKRANHVIILARNKEGLGNLYKLVTLSHVKYMHYRPRIPKKVLSEMRGGLIIGSACEAGELIRGIVAGKSDEELEEIAAFYDYLEIQPTGNNEFMIRSEEYPKIKTEEDLREINRKVVELAKKMCKPLVATTDAHFLNPEDWICRAVIMHNKNYADADKQPPLYLRTTQEMLDEFDYLDKATAYEAIVTNPNRIADSVEYLKPIPDGLYSPQVEGAQEEIREKAYAKARKLYGENLPVLVRMRLEEELKPIIGHGFAGLYLIAQRLVKKSNEDGYLVGSRGSVGSSLVATMIGITEVNPLPPHYRCPKCKYSKFFTKGEVGSGYDLKNGKCPVCGYELIKDGHDIPFAVFLGFDGDKVPDIDLKFSGEYQATAHKYTEVLFGKYNVYRAGTITTIAQKTSYGLAKSYFEDRGEKKHEAYIAQVAAGCQGVKKTTGQHPAGIMVVPRDMDINYFTPIQYPADNKEATTTTTHFDYHSISSRLVKLDILGHVDPTVIKMLERLTHRDPKTIPLDDKPTLSLFNSTSALGLTAGQLGTKSGTYGLPEFRTEFTRQMIDDTSPDCFSDLVRISGFSHGTDVWLGNAQELIRQGICTLKNAISARDDIMMYLIHHGVDALRSFKTMESVRKGKGIKEQDVADLKAHNVPDWYIESCQKIKYLFPRAHATAYVMMAYRIAYWKVHYPLAYYAAYFSKRTEAIDANEIIKGRGYIEGKLAQLQALSDERKLDDKESDLLADYQVVHEYYLRGYEFERVNLYESSAEEFIIRKNALLMSLKSIQGVSAASAANIVAARAGGKFISIEDLRSRAGINKTCIAALKAQGCLEDLQETNQMTLF